MFKDLDPKTITSAGGIVLAGLAIWGLIRISDGRLETVMSAINSNTKSVSDLSAAVSANTEIIRQLVLKQSLTNNPYIR